MVMEVAVELNAAGGAGSLHDLGLEENMLMYVILRRFKLKNKLRAHCPTQLIRGLGDGG